MKLLPPLVTTDEEDKVWTTRVVGRVTGRVVVYGTTVVNVVPPLVPTEVEDDDTTTKLVG